jgi:Zn-dependent peptidase ImmA (M78 family)
VSEFNNDVLSREDIVDKAQRDREELVEKLLEIYPRLAGRLPAELVADIIFDVCDWGIATDHLNPRQYAYCDFSSKRIFLNSKLSATARKLKVEEMCLRRTTLAHELGHIRLHPSEMENRDFRSYLGPGMGYDDSRSDQRENEAELYAAVFLAPKAMLEETEEVIVLRDAIGLNDCKEIESLNSRLSSINEELATRFKVTPNLMSRSLEAYELVIRRQGTRDSNAFRLQLATRKWRARHE